MNPKVPGSVRTVKGHAPTNQRSELEAMLAAMHTIGARCTYTRTASGQHRVYRASWHPCVPEKTFQCQHHIFDFLRVLFDLLVDLEVQVGNQLHARTKHGTRELVCFTSDVVDVQQLQHIHAAFARQFSSTVLSRLSVSDFVVGGSLVFLLGSFLGLCERWLFASSGEVVSSRGCSAHCNRAGVDLLLVRSCTNSPVAKSTFSHNYGRMLPRRIKHQLRGW